MSALRSVCCDAPVYLRTGPENNHSSSACICEACGAACTTKLNGHSPIVAVMRDLLREAADQIEEQIETFIGLYSVQALPRITEPMFNPSNQREFDRLTDLARRLRETASA